MINDTELLKDYVRNRSEPAFSRLVERHLAFVYRVCLRQTNDQQVAEDAAMAVFLLLSQKAHTIRSGVLLTSWLFSAARLTAMNAARMERRRKAAEQEAGQMLQREAQHNPDQPALFFEAHVNDALAALSQRERDAVLLRFQDSLSVAEVGQALGISENAAQVRLSRGLEKMRRVFAMKGSALEINAIATGMVAEKSHAAPEALLVKARGVRAAGPSLQALKPLLAKGLFFVSTTKIVVTAVIAAAVILCAIFASVTAWRFTHPPASPYTFTVAAPAALSTQPANAQARREILGNEEALLAADARCQPVTMLDFMAQDYKMILPNGQTLNLTQVARAEMITFHMTYGNRYSMTVTSMTVQGNEAKVISQARSDGRLRQIGQVRKGSRLVSEVTGENFWQKLNGKWICTGTKALTDKITLNGRVLANMVAGQANTAKPAPR